MDEPRQCNECGTDLGADAGPEGLCPRCLLKLALPEGRPEPDGDDVRQTPRTELPPSNDLAPTIGPYRLLRKIGEGGMGEVWEAEQREPVRRKVALKLIKAGMDTKQVVARFESERQALALMSHHSIAKVLDAGATEQGRPYFVMEHVSGVPITEYCDTQRLGTRERLELFLQVCGGVQHAHQKGIIHRDLKPTNVLVTVDEGRPVPKIIDFGVAKATQQRLTEKTLFTQLGALVGTPAYMSPEQAELTGLDVDTRTDVYSLGVLLYELLVGALPFDPRELREKGFDEIRRVIREEEPSKPSTRLNTLGGERSGESARWRRTDPASLVRDLRGDLDWITMRALEKDRVRRYGSPSDLAADIRRHLAHEPVVAGPPSAAYRARKFVRRHRLGVSAAGLVLLALVVGLGAATWGLIEARRANVEARQQAATAEQVSEFLVGLFDVSDPSEARGNTITAREVLDKGAEKIERELAEQPEIRIRLLTTIGRVHTRLGLYEAAEPLLTRALEEARAALGEDHPLTLSAMSRLSETYRMTSRWNDAERLLRAAAEGRQRVLGPHHPATLHSMRLLADVYHMQGRYRESEALFLEVVKAWRETVGEEHFSTAHAVSNLGRLYSVMARYEEAEACFVPALETMRRLRGDDDPSTLIVAYGLARLYGYQKRYEEAEALFLDTIGKLQRVLGEDHQRVLWATKNLGQLYLSQGRLEEAESNLAWVMNTSRELLGEDHLLRRQSMTFLAVVYTRRGRYEEAERLLEDGLAIYRRLNPADHPETLGVMHRLGWLRCRQGRFDQAERLLLDALAGRRRLYGDQQGHPSIAATLYGLACLEALRGERSAALSRLRESIEAGWSDADGMTRDDDLASLRGDPEFESLVKAIKPQAEKSPRGDPAP